MRSSNSGWVRSIIGIMVLSVCLVFVCLTTNAGAAAPTVTREAVSPAAAATGGSPPVIQVFKADPMTLETPTSVAVYSFKVKGAKNVGVSEAGTNIKNISNPSGATLSGTATGMPASAIPTDTSGKFKAVLIASNDDGAVKSELTLSFSDKLLAASGQPAETDGAEDQADSRSPKWLEQYSSPFGPARSSQSGTEPEFFDCPSDCDNCLEPGDAKSQGMGERCSPERCYYSPDNQRNWYCFKPSPGWCCHNLQVSQIDKEECAKLGGAWFLNQSDAMERCQQPGYCCRDGTIYQATRPDCIQAGGTYYADPVEAKERCQPPCWCCAQGKVFQATTHSQCVQSGGNCYTTQTEALERCQLQCWCCAQGKVFQATESQCRQSGGNCYANQAEAQRYCQPECWCCAQGKVFQATQSQCSQVGGNCYANQTEALRYCQPPCWCCAKGQVFQTTQSQCSQAGGNCYTTQAEALRYCQQESTCWCCAKGQVFQTTQSQCTQAGGNCYTTQSEALRYCQQEPNCWCCVNGYVKYIPQSTCIQNGGKCYSSQTEAQRYCKQILK